MTRIITYSLKANSDNSDGYRRAISSFTDTWLEQTQPGMHDLVDGFRVYRQRRGRIDRSDAEHLFELLALGVLLREHSEEASHTPRWYEKLMSHLLSLQMRFPRIERGIKTVRGWLAGAARGAERSGEILDLLIDWLGANDETVKAKRLGEWQAYFNAMGSPFTQYAVSRSLALADEFAEASREALGKYTENVGRFLAEQVPGYRHRYDVRFISCTRLEYHLGMLGTEIMNRAYRQRFLATERKMVIVPPCMCAPVEECKAAETPFGAKCQACTPGCRVNQITKLGEKRGFSVTMIPDDVKVFHAGNEAKSIGLVGVSCALTNWNGGWDAGAEGIPAQGLLLDYVGCKIHWDKEGIPTDTNLQLLQEILGL